VIVAVDGCVRVLMIVPMVAAAVVVIMVMIVRMGVRFFRFVIVVAASVIVMVLVGMSVAVMVLVGVSLLRAVVVVMIVVTGVAVGMIVGADTDGAVAMDEIEGSEEEEADSRDQSVDPEARIEVFLDAAGRVEGKKESSPDQEG